MAMATDCTKPMLPIRDTLDLLSGKWKIQIMGTLVERNKRFNELHRDIPGITAKTLSRELKELEANKLITRTVHPDTSPVAVEYGLTDYSRSLEKVVESIHDWGVEHRKNILS